MWHRHLSGVRRSRDVRLSRYLILLDMSMPVWTAASSGHLRDPTAGP